MPLPFPPNVNVLIYRVGNSPPNPADVTASGYITTDYYWHSQLGHGDPMNTRYTHTLLLPIETDIRDDYAEGVYGTNYDTVYVAATNYKVVFIAIKGLGTATAYKKVYLDRDGVDWPATNF